MVLLAMLRALLLALIIGDLCMCASQKCSQLPEAIIYDLQRTARLGGLFDPITSTLLPRTFWPQSVIGANRVVERVERVSTLVGYQQTLSDKFSLMDIDVSVKAEILGGLLRLEGFAGFTRREKTFDNIFQVVVVFKATTQHEVLDEELLQKIVFSSPHYTRPQLYVVTRLTRGVEVAATFFYRKQVDELDQDITGRFKVVLDLILFKGEGEASLNLTESQKRLLERSEMVVDADIPFTRVVTGPAGISAALEDIQRLLGEALKGSGVPIRATIEPMCRWQSDPVAVALAELERTVIDDVAQAIQTFADEAGRARTLFARADASIGLSRVASDLAGFLRAHTVHRNGFVSQLGALLPDVRGNVRDQAVLRQLLSNLAQSPFNPAAVDDWLDRQALQITLVESLVRGLPSKVLQSNTLSQALDPSVPALSIGILMFAPETDVASSLYLQAMAAYAATPGAGFPVALPADRSSWMTGRSLSRLRTLFQWISATATDGSCLATPAGFECDPLRQRLVFLDYHASRAAVNALVATSEPGLGPDDVLPEPRMILLHENRNTRELELLSANLRQCTSSCDPRDYLAECLYGYGNVPDNCACTAASATPSFLDGMCQTGKCRNGTCGFACADLLTSCNSQCVQRARDEVLRLEGQVNSLRASYNAKVTAAITNFNGSLAVQADLAVTGVTAYHEHKNYNCPLYLGGAWRNLELDSILNGDTNQESGGWYIFLCRDYNRAATRLLTDMWVTLDERCPAGSSVMRFHDGHGHDLNEGAGGENVYLCLKFMTVDEIVRTSTWPITRIRMQQSRTPTTYVNENRVSTVYTMVPFIFGSNGDLSQGAGGKDKFLFIGRSASMPSLVASHKSLLDRYLADFTRDSNLLEAQLSAAKRQLDAALNGSTVRFCPANTSINPITSQRGACPCVFRDPCATGGRTACDIAGFRTNTTTCRADPNTRAAVCQCKPGWTGPRCETEVDHCQPNPCLAGEFCMRTFDKLGNPDTYRCTAVTSCGPGQYQTSAPTATIDRQCAACPSGFFQSKFDFTGSACAPHTTVACGCGQRLIPPTPARDGACTPCRPYEFQAASNHTFINCAPVTDCPGSEVPGRCADIACASSTWESVESEQTDIAVIVGPAVGGAVALIVLVVAIVVTFRRRRDDDNNHSGATRNPAYEISGGDGGGKIIDLDTTACGNADA